MSLLRKIFDYPAANLVTVIPGVLLVSFIIGNFINTSALKTYILPLTLVMIFPTMVGFKIWEAFDLKYGKVVVSAVIINFIFIPFLAYILGILFLQNNPQMFAGLAIMALLPTSGMTISWTMLSQGNVLAAIKITVISLLMGAFVAPWYLYLMVGQFIPIDVLSIFKTISIVVFIPLFAGSLTYYILLRNMSQEEFKKRVKPQLPRISVWALLLVIFISTSNKAKMIISRPDLIIIAVIVLMVFYIANYFLATLISRIFFGEFNGFAVIYGTVMRNLSLAIGITATAFGTEAMLIITLAYIIQVQSAAWFGKAAKRYSFLKPK